MKNFSPLLNYKEIYNEKIHSLISFMITVFALVLIFIMGNPTSMVVVFLLTLFYFFYAGLWFSQLIRVISYTFSFALLYLVMLVLFPAPESLFYEQSLQTVFLSPDFWKSKEYFVFLRLFLVSSLSVLSLSVLHAEVVFLYLAQKKKMPVMFVYPLLFAINSIHLLKRKFDLYVFNNRLRQVEGLMLPRLLFQFLVFTLRFSETGALSLVARGLSEDKAYYYDFSMNAREKYTVYAFIFGFICLALVVI